MYIITIYIYIYIYIYFPLIIALDFERSPVNIIVFVIVTG